LFEYSADIIMLQLLPAVTVHWAPRHGLSSRQLTLNLAKFLAKRSPKNKRSYHGWLSTMTS